MSMWGAHIIECLGSESGAERTGNNEKKRNSIGGEFRVAGVHIVDIYILYICMYVQGCV